LERYSTQMERRLTIASCLLARSAAGHEVLACELKARAQNNDRQAALMATPKKCILKLDVALLGMQQSTEGRDRKVLEH